MPGNEARRECEATAGIAAAIGLRVIDPRIANGEGAFDRAGEASGPPASHTAAARLLLRSAAQLEMTWTLLR